MFIKLEYVYIYILRGLYAYTCIYIYIEKIRQTLFKDVASI
jgi:hypothetical protein